MKKVNKDTGAYSLQYGYINKVKFNYTILFLSLMCPSFGCVICGSLTGDRNSSLGLGGSQASCNVHGIRIFNNIFL
jgi:hypothetical protein